MDWDIRFLTVSGYQNKPHPCIHYFLVKYTIYNSKGEAVYPTASTTPTTPTTPVKPTTPTTPAAPAQK